MQQAQKVSFAFRGFLAFFLFLSLFLHNLVKARIVGLQHDYHVGQLNMRELIKSYVVGRVKQAMEMLPNVC